MEDKEPLIEILESLLAQVTVTASAISILAEQSPNQQKVIDTVNKIAAMYSGNAGDHAQKIAKIISTGAVPTSALKLR